jgi:hypothetical protein
MTPRNTSAAAKAQQLVQSQPMICAALEKAFKAGGCVLCQVLRHKEQRSLFSFLYEGMMTPGACQEFLDGGGFCARHFRLAVLVSRSEHLGLLGMAMLCSRLVPAAEEVAEHAAKRHKRPIGLARSKQDYGVWPGHACIFCRELRGTEEQLVRALEDLMDAEEFSLPLSQHGLCLRHTQLVLKGWKDEAKREWVLDVIRRYAAELTGDLKEFLRKHDYRYRHEPYGREKEIVKRCLEFLMGLDSNYP